LATLTDVCKSTIIVDCYAEAVRISYSFNWVWVIAYSKLLGKSTLVDIYKSINEAKHSVSNTTFSSYFIASLMTSTLLKNE